MSKLVPFGPGEVQSGKDKGNKRFLNFALPKLAITDTNSKITQADGTVVDAPKNDKGALVAQVSPADVMVPQYDPTPEGLAEIQQEINDAVKSSKLLVDAVNSALIAESRVRGTAAANAATTGTPADAAKAIIDAMSAVTLASLLEERTRGVSGNIKVAKENASELSAALQAAGNDPSKLSADLMAKMLETISLLTKG